MSKPIFKPVLRPVGIPYAPTEEELRTLRLEAKYVVPASNHHHQSAQIGVRIPPEFEAKVEQLLMDAKYMGKWPWDSMGEIYRYLLFHGLETLEDPPEGLREFLAGFRLEQVLEHHRLCQVEIAQYLGRLDARIREAEKAEGAQRVKALVESAHAVALNTPPGHWHDVLVEQIVKRWGAFLS